MAQIKKIISTNISFIIIFALVDISLVKFSSVQTLAIVRDEFGNKPKLIPLFYSQKGYKHLFSAFFYFQR